MTAARHTPASALGALLVFLAGVLAALALAGPADAASTCGQKVLADWFDNGRVDRLYPLHCYEDAIDLIPEDLLPYADAEEVISRALAQALKNELAPGGCDPSPDGSKDDCKPGATGSGGKKPGTKPGGTTTDTTGDDPTGSEAVPEVDTSAATSIPVPLLVLGGMSVALLAAGGLGYASRRRQAGDSDSYDGDPSA